MPVVHSSLSLGFKFVFFFQNWGPDWEKVEGFTEGALPPIFIH